MLSGARLAHVSFWIVEVIVVGSFIAAMFLLFFRHWVLAGILAGCALALFMPFVKLARHVEPATIDYERLGKTFRWW